MMKSSVTVLVIEDSVDDFTLLKEMLNASEEMACLVIQAERLESAISIAREKPIDVAIIDLSLPDSFGLDSFASFHEHYPNIPAVIMTGVKSQKMALEAVQKGAQDYLFKGEPSATAIIRTIRYAIERQRLTSKLKQALEQVKQLQGLLPICSVCKKIRDDKGYWNQIESYISKHSEAVFSHGICPDCGKKLYPDLKIFQD